MQVLPFVYKDRSLDQFVGKGPIKHVIDGGAKARDRYPSYRDLRRLRRGGGLSLQKGFHVPGKQCFECRGRAGLGQFLEQVT